MIKAVIFDLDDTLIAEKEYVKSGYKAIAKIIKKEYQIKKTEREIFNNLMKLFEKDNKNVFNRLLDIFEITYKKEDIFELVKQYREHNPNIKFYKDVIPTIKKLKEKNIKIGIITDGYLSTQSRKIKKLKGDRIFDKIILTDELGREYWKPNIKAFQIMKEYLNIEFNEMMYVGDNPEKDFYISNAYPIICVRVCRGNGIHKNEKYKDGIKEKYKIKNLKELNKIIFNNK